MTYFLRKKLKVLGSSGPSIIRCTVDTFPVFEVSRKGKKNFEKLLNERERERERERVREREREREREDGLDLDGEK